MYEMHAAQTPSTTFAPELGEQKALEDEGKTATSLFQGLLRQGGIAWLADGL